MAQQKFNIRLALRNSFASFVASRHCILVVHHISLTSCNTISPQGLCAHPLLISYLFRDITYHLDPVLSASQPHGSGTNSIPLSIRETQSLPAFKRHLKTQFLQSAYRTPYRSTIQRALIL